MQRYRFAKSKDGRDYKVDCPMCGGKRRFKRFYDEQEMTLLPQEYGICDRENSCGYMNPPTSQVIEAPKRKPQPKKISYLPMELVTRSLKTTGKDILSKFLIQHYKHQAHIVLKDYAVASVKFNGEYQPLFWLISDKNTVHSGKIMSYKMIRNEPKRLKSDNTWESFDWIHTKFKDFNYSPMAFGSHLLPLYPTKKVAIVESEKTALIMACHSPQYIWLATSSMNCLQKEYLPDLSKRDVILYPDKGDKAFGYWTKKLREFKEENLVLSGKINIFVEQCDSLQQGDDIADYVLKQIT